MPLHPLPVLQTVQSLAVAPTQPPSAPSDPVSAAIGSETNATAAKAADGAVVADANDHSQQSLETVAVSKPVVAPVPAAKEKTPQKVSSRFGIDGFVIDKKHGKHYAVLKTRGHAELLLIGSTELNARLRGIARKTSKQLKKFQLEEINEELRSEAEEARIEGVLYPRVGPLANGGVAIDSCDGAGTAFHVSATGVQVMSGTSPVMFLRSASALPLPVPSIHGDYRLVRKYLNMDPVQFLLYIAWVAFTIASPKIASTKYVFLVVKGQQGTGKSLACKQTQRLIDPNAVGVQMLPGSPRDLAIILQSVHLLVVDNMRDLSTLISDTLCIAATGGSIPMRKLYTDDEQKALHLHGAILFNGIHPFMGQSDFADRCMVLELLPIAPEARKSEAQMQHDFEVDYPVILGGLYQLIAKTLQKLPEAEILAPSRMLDFCRWLAATELAMGLDAGALQLPYSDSLRDAQLESLLDNPLAVTIIAFAENMDEPEWVGTPTDFYNSLTTIADFSLQRSRAWPSSAAVLSKRLHGLQAPLQAQGISIDWTRGKDRQIVVRATKAPKQQTPSAAIGGPSDPQCDF
jgi:hypothetical protein